MKIIDLDILDDTHFAVWFETTINGVVEKKLAFCSFDSEDSCSVEIVSKEDMIMVAAKLKKTHH